MMMMIATAISPDDDDDSDGYFTKFTIVLVMSKYWDEFWILIPFTQTIFIFSDIAFLFHWLSDFNGLFHTKD